MNKKASTMLDVLPLALIFFVGTAMILAIGFFLINYVSATASVTGYSVFGKNCTEGNCNTSNAGIMALVIISLVIFQYFFYRRYRKKTGR